MTSLDNFHGPNIGYVLELYDRYRQNPESVDAATRAFFQNWTPPEGVGSASTDGASFAADSVSGTMDAPSIEKIVGAVNLAQSIREYGHLAAQLDPLGSEPIGDPSLELATYGLNEDDLREFPASLIGGPIAAEAANALDAIQKLRAVYSSRIGYDYDHIRIPEERNWLREAAETGRYRAPNDPINPEALLLRLTQVEAFERFIHRIFPGKTRFSIEGLDMMVPILDETIGSAADEKTLAVLIGMAHRGRLNVLTHILNKPYVQLLAEFKDPVEKRTFNHNLGWTGDVKYHSGARRAIQEGQPVDLVVSMAPNPSHLEAVNPVVEGMARAVGTQVDQPGEPQFDPDMTLQILIHGDASFPAQGIVAETLNLSQLPGYWTGGTLHIIANNQLGYTTRPNNARSTIYASDLAKGFKMPIVHVNADDPEACIEVARMAYAYLSQFEKDFVIDLIGYRRYGHNEGDEPGFTQPVMYRKIEKHPTVRDQWGKTLVERGDIDAETPEAMLRRQMEELQAVLESLNVEKDLVEAIPLSPVPGTARRTKTSVPIRKLQALNEALLTVPEGFNLNPKIARGMQKRRDSLKDADARVIDWSTAEQLAFGSILADGIAIRMTGQDVERGTFSQRHAVFHDVENGDTFTPLQALPQAKAAFEIHDSPLSENAAIGFEYGYNVQAPERFVLWEAQYGDFINGAQTILDEFLLSARAKWGQTPSLALLLPHGWEGQGPDHSTGRVERFLQQAAETNLRIANCTTPAQYFHLLRRQALLLKSDPLPLIVLTPKSLLRHRLVVSSLRELAEGSWQPVIDDAAATERREQVTRLLLCSGKIYVDLISSEHRAANPSIAIVRVEQLYPFPSVDLAAVLERYPNVEQVIWTQEEPENMGAWEFARPLLEELNDGNWTLGYVGRARNSSPAEGSSSWHSVNQAALIEDAYRLVVEQVTEGEE
ncbi:MAG: 2-oxoglutarate dehydrogenase E1 component [Burkholderiales bacterium]|nr:2-oxoglutarate dehydrogenase E1 component [Anaerolineae bacterium]